MAHRPVGGADGSLAALWRAAAPAPRSTSTSTTPTPCCATTRRSARRRRQRDGRSPATGWSSRCDRDAAAAARRARSSSRGCAAKASSRYHDHHRYHALMHEGKLTRVQLQQWVLNRYYYQTRIPIKDALILSKSEDPAFRRMWIRRIRDHDGDERRRGRARAVAAAGRRRRPRPRGGRELPLACCPACASPATPTSSWCASGSLVEAVASSLTEFFAPDLMSKRVLAWEKHYPWVSAGHAGLLPRARPARPARLRGGDRLRRARTRRPTRCRSAASPR